MTTIIAAFKDGWGRVLRARAVLLGAFAVTWLVVVPAGLILEQSGAAARAAAAGTAQSAGESPGRWLPPAQGPATGFDGTMTPTLVGAYPFLSQWRAFLADGTLPIPLVAATATMVLVWTFLLGGILDRYARRRPVRTTLFFAACGTFFFRFLRLAFIGAVGYVLLFGLVHEWVFPPAYPWAPGGAAAGPASALLPPLYIVFLGLAAFWSMLMDYSRIRAVVEDRRSMLGAFLAGWRFVTRNPLKAGGLYLLNAAAFVLLLVVYARTAPGESAGFAVAQAYLFARVALRLAFFASETALFQRTLAHVDYTASPRLLWPESPAAEEIVNAAPRAGQQTN